MRGCNIYTYIHEHLFVCIDIWARAVARPFSFFVHESVSPLTRGRAVLSDLLHIDPIDLVLPPQFRRSSRTLSPSFLFPFLPCSLAPVAFLWLAVRFMRPKSPSEHAKELAKKNVRESRVYSIAKYINARERSTPSKRNLPRVVPTQSHTNTRVGMKNERKRARL